MHDFNGSFDPREMSRSGFSMMRSKDDESLYVQFYDRPIFNAFKTQQAEKEAEAAGLPKPEPVFDKKVYCKIRPPGRLEEHDQPAREQDKARFPREWQLYLNGNKEFSGTSLEEIPNLAEDHKAHLRYLGVHTAEQLASATDSQLQAIGWDARELQARARKVMSERENALPKKLEAENSKLKEMLSSALARLDALEASKQRIDEPETKEKPRKDK